MPETLDINPILSTPPITNSFTIIHPKEGEGECFQVSPSEVSLKTGQTITFKAEGADFQIELVQNGYTFNPNKFELTRGNNETVEVLFASDFDLTIEGKCYVCNPGSNTEGRKKIVIKYAGETVDQQMSKKFSDIIRDIADLKTKVNSILHK